MSHDSELWEECAGHMTHDHKRGTAAQNSHPAHISARLHLLCDNGHRWLSLIVLLEQTSRCSGHSQEEGSMDMLALEEQKE